VRSRCLIVLLLLGYAAALGWEAWRVGVTADEPSHLAAGYAWWAGRDVLYPSDTPPLTRIVGGWVPRVLGARPGAWEGRDAYNIGYGMLEAAGARGSQRLKFWCRLPFLMFPLLTVFLVWHWGRRIFRESTALALAGCAALEPTLLGHGALINSDAAATCGCLLFAYAGWRYWRAPGWRTLAGLTGALMVAALAKFTGLALIPVALALVLWRGPRLAGAVFVAASVYLGVATAYQFRFAPVPLLDFERTVSRPRSLPERALRAAPWPAQFARGVRFISMHSAGDGFGGYLLGRRIEGAAPWYFPLAWAIKFPIALQLAALAGLALAWRRPWRAEAFFIWGTAAYLAALAVHSHMHIGFRHLLPVLPLMILGAGFALDRVRHRAVAAVLVLAVAASSLRVYPHGISYFNEWIGGPENGWKYLADSNLDWGQDLPDLADYVLKNRIPVVKTYLFGLDSLERYLPGERFEPQMLPLDESWRGPARVAPGPGVYAVSVNRLLGVFTPAYPDYLAWFRERRPVGRAGYSILIYQVEGRRSIPDGSVP
jgi:hypothetical protein